MNFRINISCFLKILTEILIQIILNFHFNLGSIDIFIILSQEYAMLFIYLEYHLKSYIKNIFLMKFSYIPLSSFANVIYHFIIVNDTLINTACSGQCTCSICYVRKDQKILSGHMAVFIFHSYIYWLAWVSPSVVGRVALRHGLSKPEAPGQVSGNKCCSGLAHTLAPSPIFHWPRLMFQPSTTGVGKYTSPMNSVLWEC